VLSRLKSVERTSDRVLELSSHSLNVSVNTFVGIEAILGPTNDSHLLTQFLQLMRTSQVLHVSFLNAIDQLCVEMQCLLFQKNNVTCCCVITFYIRDSLNLYWFGFDRNFMSVSSN